MFEFISKLQAIGYRPQVKFSSSEFLGGGSRIRTHGAFAQRFSRPPPSATRPSLPTGNRIDTILKNLGQYFIWILTCHSFYDFRSSLVLNRNRGRISCGLLRGSSVARNEIGFYNPRDRIQPQKGKGNEAKINHTQGYRQPKAHYQGVCRARQGNSVPSL